MIQFSPLDYQYRLDSPYCCSKGHDSKASVASLRRGWPISPECMAGFTGMRIHKGRWQESTVSPRNDSLQSKSTVGDNTGTSSITSC